MAPALTEPDKDPDSPRTLAEEGAAPPRRPRRIGRTLHALLKSNLKNLLADCGAQLDVRAANGLHDFSPSDVGAMKNVLGEHCKPTNGIMDSEKPEKEDVMGLHSANSSNLQDLLNNKKQLAGSLLASSPPPDLVDMIHEFETLAEAAPLASGNGDVPADEMQMINRLVTSMDEAMDEAPAAAPAAEPVSAPAAVPATVEATRDRQAQLAGRSARLLRRLRALEAHAARHQTSSQANALLDRLSAVHTAPAPAATATSTAAAPSGDITEMLRSPNAKHFSTTQLVNLVLNNKTATAAVAVPAPAPPPPPPSESAAASARLEREVASAAVRPAGVARRQLQRLATAEDSDATESSSGGESGDEFDHGWDDEAQERAAPIRKRALWRWATERSAVACRWSWLAAQVTDLEFRVRQLRQLHRQLHATNPRPAAGRGSGCAGGRQAALRELGGAGDASSATPRDRTKASDVTAAAAADGDEGDGQCARTRRWPAGARRRVFSVARTPRRPAGGAAARCRCDPGSDSCPMCAGRPDHTASVRPETQPPRERRALLEPGHHPVLSLPAEAALSLGYDALLRSSRWQQNHLHARPRGPRVITKETGGQPLPAGVPASAATGTPGMASAMTPGMTSPMTSAAPPRPVTPCSRPSFHRRKSGVLKRLSDLDGGGELALGGSNGRIGRPPKLARRSRSASASVSDARPAAGAGPPPPFAADDDPAWTPGRQSPERRESRERPPAHRARHRQNSYDIDNIVIPASMASTARIEKPKYKEIVTPGWRSVELRPAALNGDPAAAVVAVEPLDDAACEQRHLPAELDERRRLYQAAGQPGVSGAAAAGGPGHGRGRRAHTPDAPPPTDGGPAERPRILRYLYSLEPCGFASRQFPLSDRAWKELLAAAAAGVSSPGGWRSPHSLAGSSTESAPETEEHRALK